jgi:hypothetical protein
MLNIVTLAKEDMLQLIQQVNAQFDPDQALGTVLDQRCAINGVLRLEGTYTEQYVSVTASQATTVQGIDNFPNAPFTVADTAGNQYVLVNTYNFSGAGTSSLLFQAALIGAVTPSINTITSIVTPTLGVTSVINPLAPSSLGVNEQTDASLRIARRQAISKGSRSFEESISANVFAVAGVTSVQVYENPGNGLAWGVPSNSIWVIVTGGVALQVAQAINISRGLGVGMHGSTNETVTNPDGSTIVITFDYATPENLYISFAYAVVTGQDPGGTFLANQIAANLTYLPGQIAVASVITAFVQSIAPNISITAMSVGNAPGPTNPTALPTGANYQWVVSASNITT